MYINKEKKQSNISPQRSLWDEVMYPNKYYESNIKNADYRGGLWRSMNYHTYIPKKDEMAYPNDLWYSTMYGKGKRPIHSLYEEEKVDNEGMEYPFEYPNKLPRTSTGAVDYSKANKALEDYLNYHEGELKAQGIKPDYPSKSKRGVIDRIFDAANIGQYSVMGALYNATDKNPDTKWYKGFWEGIKSGNPFGKDYKEYEKSFSDILDNLGWEKEKSPDAKWYKPSDVINASLDRMRDVGNAKSAKDVLKYGFKPRTWSPNNVAHNIVSLAGNIFLDPLNYLSLGAKELISGTGKTVGKDVISETTDATAKKVLKEVGEEATENNVKEIIRQLDNLKGIKKGGRGISYGLQNVPFLNKIGKGKYNKTLVDADTIRKFSDDIGIGAATNKALTGFRESKLGKLFNTNVDLRQLAKLDDFEAGKILKFIDQGYGRNAKQIMKNLESIEWINKNLKNLSGEEQELITKLLENPDKWEDAIYKVDFSDTDLGKELYDEVDDFLNAESAKDIFKESDAGNVLSDKEINKLVTQFTFDEKNKAIKDFLNTLPDDVPISIGDYYEYLKGTTTPQKRGAFTRAMNKLIEDKPGEHIVKELGIEEVSKVEKIATAFDELNDGISVNKYSNKENVNKIVNQIDIITNKTTKSNNITYEDIIRLIEEAKDKDVVTWRNYRDFYDMDNFNKVRQDLINKPVKNNFDKIEVLNEALFGGKEVISVGAKEYQIKDIYNMFVEGKPYGDIVELVDKNFKSSLSIEGVNIHEHLRNKFGYGNYQKDVLDNIDKYKKKIDKDIKQKLVNLSPREKKEYNELLKRYRERKFIMTDKEMARVRELADKSLSYDRKYKELFASHPEYKNYEKYKLIEQDRNLLNKELYSKTPSELQEYLTKQSNKSLEDIIEEGYSSTTSSARDKFVMEQEAERVAKEFTDPIDVNKIRNDVSQKYFNMNYDEVIKNAEPNLANKMDFIDNEVRDRINYIKRSHADAMRYKRNLKLDDIGKEGMENFLLEKSDPLFNVNYQKADKGMKIASKNASLDDFLSQRVKSVDEVAESGSTQLLRVIDLTKDKDSIKNITPDVVRNIDFTKDIEPKEVKNTFSDFVTSLNDKTDTTDTIMKSYEKLVGDAYNDIQDYFKQVIEGKYPGNLQEKFKLYYDAVGSNEVFEALGRAKYGDDVVDSVTTKVRSIVIDDIDVDKQIIKITNELSKLFDDMFVKELNLGVMPPDKYVGGYVPHVLTSEAEQFITKSKNKGLITDMFGFGKEFNVHSLERKHKGTIEAINEYMKNNYGIDKFFETEISDIYLARAMKHNNVVYDKKFTNELFDKFGKKIQHITELGKDDKAILSYHDLKNFTYRLSEKDKSKFFKELGIDEKLLDTYITPLIELTSDNVKAISKYSDGLPIYGVNNIMVEHANKIAKIQHSKDINTLLKLHDKFLHLYKMNVTAVMPGFHVRNKYSNMFQNYLDIGSEAIHPKNQMQATQILTGKDGFVKTRFGKKISFEEIRQYMSAYGLTDSGYFTGELKDGVISGNKFNLGDVSVNPFNEKDFIPYKLGRSFGGFIENQDKVVNFVANLKLGRNFAESAEHVNKFLFDYNDLTDFEMNVVRRIIPFYTWLRKNTPLQLEMMLEKPEIYRNLFKIFQTFEDNVKPDDKIDKEYLNDFAKDWIQLPSKVKNPEGREEPLLWNPNLPYDDVDRFYNPLTPVDSTKKLITQMNPLIKMPIELATNRNIYFDSDIEKYPGHTVDQPGYLDPIGHYKGEPAQMSPKVRYVLDQIASLKALGKFVEKKGFDRTVHGINTLGGVKVMSYDYDKYKYYILRDRLKELEKLEKKSKYR